MDRTIDRPEYSGQFLIGEATDVLADALSRARIDANVEAQIDTLAEAPPLEDPNQQCLDLSQRARRRGGKTKRPPPPADWIIAPCDGRPTIRRPGFPSPFLDIAAAPDSRAAEMLGHVYTHRGRRMGLSARDYAWQAEVTQARSLTYGFFDSQRSLERPPSISDIAAAGILGNQETPARRRFIALLCTADRMRKLGFTASGPELANLCRCVVSTAWAVVAWAEKRGIVFRMHRWKPGRDPNGAPVENSSNWYGIGPGLLRFRDLYLGQAELAIGGETIPGMAADALAAVRTGRRKHRARHTRTRRRIGERRRGQATGFAAGQFHDRPEQRPGAAMPPMAEFAGLILEGETPRDHARAKLAASDADRDSEIANQARAMLAGESSAPNFDAIQAADIESRADAVAAIQDVGGLEAIEPSAEAEAAIVWLAWQATRATETGTGAEARPVAPDRDSVSRGVLGAVPQREPPRDTIRSADGTPERNTGMERTGERRGTGPKTPRETESRSGATGRASAPVSASATPHDTTSGANGPDTRKPPPSHARPETRPQEPDRPPPVAAGRIPQGNRPIRKPKRDRGNVGDASAGALETAIAAMANRELADLIGASIQ